MKRITIFLAGAVLMATTVDAASAPGVVGTWRGPSSEVEIAPCADRGEMCGRIIWLSKPLDTAGRPVRDIHNPDPGRRAQPLIGLLILTGFRPDGDGRWTGGRIYSPDDGHTYDSKLALVGNDQLKLDGCFLIICKAVILRRVGR